MKLIFFYGHIDICFDKITPGNVIIHFVRENDYLRFIRIHSKRLRHFCGIRHPVSGQYGSLHRYHTATEKDPVIGIFLQAGERVKKFFKNTNRLIRRHVFNHHGKIIIVTTCARVNKIRIVHSFSHIAQYPVCRIMSVYLVYYAKFLDIKMNKRIITDTAESRHLKKSQKMIPVIMFRNRLMKRHLIQRGFIKRVNIIRYDFSGHLAVRPALIE